MNEDSTYFHNFVDQELNKKGLSIILLDEQYINSRLLDCMNFVNHILEEYKKEYTLWEARKKEWFLNPMNKKWEFSYIIENNKKEICLLNFTSVYGNVLHNHCTFVGKNYRNNGLGKLHMIKVSQRGIDAGYSKYEGYWDKRNNGSIILHLKMGFKIESMRKEEQLLLVGDLSDIRNRTLILYKKDFN